MLAKQIWPTDAKSDEKLGLNPIQWWNAVTLAAMPTLHHEDEVIP